MPPDPRRDPGPGRVDHLHHHTPVALSDSARNPGSHQLVARLNIEYQSIWGASHTHQMEALQTDEQITPITTTKQHRTAGRVRHRPRSLTTAGEQVRPSPGTSTSTPKPRPTPGHPHSTRKSRFSQDHVASYRVPALYQQSIDDGAAGLRLRLACLQTPSKSDPAAPASTPKRSLPQSKWYLHHAAQAQPGLPAGHRDLIIDPGFYLIELPVYLIEPHFYVIEAHFYLIEPFIAPIEVHRREEAHHRETLRARGQSRSMRPEPKHTSRRNARSYTCTQMFHVKHPPVARTTKLVHPRSRTGHHPSAAPRSFTSSSEA